MKLSLEKMYNEFRIMYMENNTSKKEDFFTELWSIEQSQISNNNFIISLLSAILKSEAQKIDLDEKFTTLLLERGLLERVYQLSLELGLVFEFPILYNGFNEEIENITKRVYEKNKEDKPDENVIAERRARILSQAAKEQAAREAREQEAIVERYQSAIKQAAEKSAIYDHKRNLIKIEASLSEEFGYEYLKYFSPYELSKNPKTKGLKINITHADKEIYIHADKIITQQLVDLVVSYNQIKFYIMFSEDKKNEEFLGAISRIKNINVITKILPVKTFINAAVKTVKYEGFSFYISKEDFNFFQKTVKLEDFKNYSNNLFQIFFPELAVQRDTLQQAYNEAAFAIEIEQELERADLKKMLLEQVSREALVYTEGVTTYSRDMNFTNLIESDVIYIHADGLSDLALMNFILNAKEKIHYSIYIALDKNFDRQASVIKDKLKEMEISNVFIIDASVSVFLTASHNTEKDRKHVFLLDDDLKLFQKNFDPRLAAAPGQNFNLEDLFFDPIMYVSVKSKMSRLFQIPAGNIAVTEEYIILSTEDVGSVKQFLIDKKINIDDDLQKEAGKIYITIAEADKYFTDTGNRNLLTEICIFARERGIYPHLLYKNANRTDFEAWLNKLLGYDFCNLLSCPVDLEIYSEDTKPFTSPDTKQTFSESAVSRIWNSGTKKDPLNREAWTEKPKLNESILAVVRILNGLYVANPDITNISQIIDPLNKHFTDMKVVYDDNCFQLTDIANAISGIITKYHDLKSGSKDVEPVSHYQPGRGQFALDLQLRRNTIANYQGR
jgi:hypothetical protein